MGEFADKIGITPANVAVLKNVRAVAVRFSTLDAICPVFDCQPGDILLWEGWLMLAFQKVDGQSVGKNSIHLDLAAPDLDAEVDRLLTAGATLVERRGEKSFRWVTLADPQSNEFDVAEDA